MLFALTAAIIAFIAYIFTTILGMALMPSAVLDDNLGEENKEFVALISPILGAAIWIPCIVSLGLIIGFTRPLIYTLFAIAFVFIYLKRDKIFIPSSKIYWIFLSIILVAAFAGCCSIAPLEFDGKIYFGTSMYDHVKAALIDSIAQYGLPPKNPWIADNGVPVNVIYYYGLQAFAAQLTLLTGISGYMADTALVIGFCVLISTSTVMAFTLKLAQKTNSYKLCHKKILLVSFCLMFFAWRLSAYFELLPQGIKSALSPNLTVLGFWPTENGCIWSSQHCVAAAFVMLIIYLYYLLLSCRDKKNTIVLTVFIGVIASASVITSLYAGVFPFGFLLVALAFVYVKDNVFRKDFNSKLTYKLCALAIAFIIAFPYLTQFFTQLGSLPVEFGVQPAYGDSFRGGLFHILKYLFSFYFIILPKQLGLFYVLGVSFILVHIFNPKVIKKQDRFILFGELLTFSTLIFISFIHSTVYSNDFGWRTLEPTLLFLNAFASLCFVKIYNFLYENKKKLAYAFIVIIAIIQVVALLYPQDSEPIEIRTDYPDLRLVFTKSIKGWEKVREVTDEKDLVLSNPVTFKNLCYVGNIEDNYWVDTFFSCYARRSTPVSDPLFSWCYSINYDMNKLKARFNRVVKFFEGNPAQAEVDYIIDDLKVKAILVTPLDGLWENEGKLLTRYKKVFSTDDYKVFVKN